MIYVLNPRPIMTTSLAFACPTNVSNSAPVGRRWAWFNFLQPWPPLDNHKAVSQLIGEEKPNSVGSEENNHVSHEDQDPGHSQWPLGYKSVLVPQRTFLLDHSMCGLYGITFMLVESCFLLFWDMSHYIAPDGHKLMTGLQMKTESWDPTSAIRSGIFQNSSVLPLLTYMGVPFKEMNYITLWFWI